MKKIYLAAFSLLAAAAVHAQCGAGELPFSMNLYTDDWGYEVYWEMVPEGNACGVGTIVSGGNAMDVGCNGGGQQDAADGNGYASNEVIQQGTFCLTEGQDYSIYFVDDYGDGGLTFEIFEDGNLFVVLAGAGDGSVWTITPGSSPIPDYSNPCNAEAIALDGTPLMLNNDFAFAPIAEPEPDGFDCGAYGFWCEGNATKTVWATVVIPDAGAYLISTCNTGTEPDTQVAVYIAEDCSDYGTYTLISSNDDVPGGCSEANGYASACYVSCLAPGTTILIQMDGFFGESGDIYLTVSPYGESATANPIVYDSACPESKGEGGSGAAVAQISGWGSDYSISWNGPDGFSSQEFAIFNLTPGDYGFVATNNCGASLNGYFTVGAAEPFQAAAQVTQPTCASSSNGSIQLTFTGGTAPYTFEWTGPGGYVSDAQNPTGLMAGNYFLTATDQNGCLFLQNFTVTAGSGLSVNLGANTTICLNQSVTLSGPNGLTYLWSTNEQTQSITLTGEGLGVGQHTIILNVSDTAGCNGAGSVTITVDNCIGVEEQGLEALAVYPNPATDVLRLTGLPSVRVSLALTAMDGRLVMRNETNGSAAYTLPVADLARGVYLLDISSDNGMTVKRKVVLE